MVLVSRLKLKFLVKQKSNKSVVIVRAVPSRVTYTFIFNRLPEGFLFTSNRTRLFFKRFCFTTAIIDRLVKNGLIN